MKKRLSIGVVVCLAITFFIPPLSAQAQYSYRFEKFLELIDYYYLQPNNLSIEQIEKNNPRALIDVFGHALYQQACVVLGGKSNALSREFKKDLEKYSYEIIDKSEYPTITLIIMSGGDCSAQNKGLLMKMIKQYFGENFRTEGERMPSFEQWASDGYPPFEIAVRPIPPPEPAKEKPPVQGKKAVRDDEKAIKLLEEEGESTEDLSIDNEYWPVEPDPSSAPDFDEFMKGE